MSITGKSPDAASVKAALYDLKSKLVEKNDEGVKETLRKLASDSNPQFTADLIAPCLFLGKSDSLHLDQHESLSLLMYLATCEPATFLKPASRAVKKVHGVLLQNPRSDQGTEMLRR